MVKELITLKSETENSHIHKLILLPLQIKECSNTFFLYYLLRFRHWGLHQKRNLSAQGDLVLDHFHIHLCSWALFEFYSFPHVFCSLQMKYLLLSLVIVVLLFLLMFIILFRIGLLINCTVCRYTVVICGIQLHNAGNKYLNMILCYLL